MEEDYILCTFRNLLHESVQSMKKYIINEHLYKHSDRINFTLSIHVVFEKAVSSEIKTSAILTSKTFTMKTLYVDVLKQHLHDAAEGLFRDIETYKGCENEWIISQLHCLDISMTSF